MYSLQANMNMAFLSSSLSFSSSSSSSMSNSHSLTHPHPFSHSSSSNYARPGLLPSSVVTLTTSQRILFKPIAAAHVCPEETQQRRRRIDKSLVLLSEAFSEDQLWAAASLRVRSFYEFSPSTFRVQDHRMYLTEREFEALKERVAGKREGFKRVSCINATVPLIEIQHFSDDLCDSCRFLEGGEVRVVVGTLDLNQCIRLQDEICGKRPEGIGADFARAYLSNVCVAKELHRNGLGYALMEKSRLVAQEWGISDLYVHVAVDNEPAKNLYMRSGFIFESEEPAWQARFLDRPRRLLLWTGLPIQYEL